MLREILLMEKIQHDLEQLRHVLLNSTVAIQLDLKNISKALADIEKTLRLMSEATREFNRSLTNIETDSEKR